MHRKVLRKLLRLEGSVNEITKASMGAQFNRREGLAGLSDSISPPNARTSCLLLDKEVFLRFLYHPLQTPAAKVHDGQTQVRLSRTAGARQSGACRAQGAAYSRAAANRAQTEAHSAATGIERPEIKKSPSRSPDHRLRRRLSA